MVRIVAVLVLFAALATGQAQAQDANELKFERIVRTLESHGKELAEIHRNLYRPPGSSVQTSYAPTYGPVYARPASYQGVVYYPGQGQSPQLYDPPAPYGYGYPSMPNYPRLPYYPQPMSPSGYRGVPDLGGYGPFYQGDGLDDIRMELVRRLWQVAERHNMQLAYEP